MASLPFRKLAHALNRFQPLRSVVVLRLAFLSFVLLLTPQTVWADEEWIDNPQPQSALPAGAGGAETSSFASQPSVSAAQAASRVRQLHGGRVLSVSPARRGNSLGYRVRVLVDGGRVKTVYVRSGQANVPSGTDRSEFRTIGDG